MDNKNLILVGGGGHCKSVIDVAESVGYKILGILDLPKKEGMPVLGYKVIGTDEDIPLYVKKTKFIVTVGSTKNSSIRIKLYNQIKKAGGKLATIIASDAYVSKYATIGEGTVVLHKAMVNAGANIGANCIINTFCNIEHDVSIGIHSHISTGTMVNGEAIIGESCFIGSGSIVYNCISICSDTIVAAGSVVSRNIVKPGIYAGNTAKLIK